MTHERKEITRKLAASAETPDRARLDLSLCVDHALDWGGDGCIFKSCLVSAKKRRRSCCDYWKVVHRSGWMALFSIQNIYESCCE